MNCILFKSIVGGGKNHTSTCCLPTNSRHIGKSHIAWVMDDSDIKSGLHGRFIKAWVNPSGIRWFHLGGDEHTVLKIQIRLIQHVTADQNPYITHRDNKLEKAASEACRYVDLEKIWLFKVMTKSPYPIASSFWMFVEKSSLV